MARQRGYNDCEPKLNSPTFGRGRRDNKSGFGTRERRGRTQRHLLLNQTVTAARTVLVESVPQRNRNELGETTVNKTGRNDRQIKKDQ